MTKQKARAVLRRSLARLHCPPIDAKEVYKLDVNKPDKIKPPAKPYQFQFFRDKKRDHHVRLVAPNGRILWKTSEGYKRKGKALNALLSLCRAMDNYVIKTMPEKP